MTEKFLFLLQMCLLILWFIVFKDLGLPIIHNSKNISNKIIAFLLGIVSLSVLIVLMFI